MLPQLKGAPDVQPVQEKRVRFLSSQPNDDAIWAMFHRYVFVTVKQASTILDRKFHTVDVRLRRLEETGYLGRVQQNDFSPLLYFISKKGAEEAVARGEMQKAWFISKKSLSQIPHEIGITNCQL